MIYKPVRRVVGSLKGPNDYYVFILSMQRFSALVQIEWYDIFKISILIIKDIVLPEDSCYSIKLTEKVFKFILFFFKKNSDIISLLEPWTRFSFIPNKLSCVRLAFQLFVNPCVCKLFWPFQFNILLNKKYSV